ncbi:hypothetical protein DHEL01_v209349 [Diaporthe helianthi]|uniref:Uncharacterized protein n=1 Tax=Diaporthe helianthi TaxID=158607 RepID=A0A2P5HPT4_DIAHE|nr:hypothetical protein DHEL01_v209349 [Diaporthe helianthi]
MSTQNTSSPSIQQEEEQPSPNMAITPTTFTRMLDLPTEIQIQMWAAAFRAPRQPRLAALRIYDAPSTSLSHQVLNLNNLQASLGWAPSNHAYLAETDHVASLLAVSHRSQTIIRPLARQLHTPWLERLGLAPYHLDPTRDIVFFGYDGDILDSSRFMIAAGLVLGNELQNIMVPAAAFWRLVRAELMRGLVDPVLVALTALRNVDPVWHEVFRPGPTNPLRWPGLPRDMFFLLGPLPRCSRHGSRECLHFEHLQISSLAELHAPFNPHASASFQFYNDLAFIEDIKKFWANVRNLSNFTGPIPNIFFVRLSPGADELTG